MTPEQLIALAGNQSMQSQLAELLDRHGLTAVLGALSLITKEKAESSIFPNRQSRWLQAHCDLAHALDKTEKLCL